MQDIFFANIEEIKLKCVQNSLIQTTFVVSKSKTLVEQCNITKTFG